MAVISPLGWLEALGAVAGLRKRRGVRHRFISILVLCACVVLAGVRSFIAIAEWVRVLISLLCGKLGFGRVPPCEFTLQIIRTRRLFAGQITVRLIMPRPC